MPMTFNLTAVTQPLQQFYNDTKVGFDSLNEIDSHGLFILAGVITVYAISGIISGTCAPKCRNRCWKSTAYLYGGTALAGTVVIALGTLLDLEQKGIFLQNLKASGLTIQSCLQKCNELFHDTYVSCPEACKPLFANTRWLKQLSG